MSDAQGPVAAVNPDPNATADQLFVSATEVPDNQPPQGQQQQGPLRISDLGDTRISLRAQNKDWELTPAELQTTLEKGLKFDALTADKGKLKPAADNWQQWEQSMHANPGAALAAYANQYDLVVGRVNKEGYFEAVDATSGPDLSSGDSTPEVQALTTELNEMKALLTQVLQGQTTSQQEQALATSHGATPDEIEAAKVVAIERGLPEGNLDIALALVRQGKPAPQGQAQQPQGVTADDLLALLKAGNPVLSSAGQAATPPAPKAYHDMTPDERTRAAWEASKKAHNVQTVNSIT